ncbi:ATP-binding protein [Paenibacillus sp. NPDC056579]|uniref:ATP-binding protein n=1 Tax=Paenibacillus sp. NPDC056579 TaxID=3345871 RepID=UPI0036A8349F
MAVNVKKHVSKVSIEYPISYFEGNLLVNQHKELWAVYEFDPFNYDHLSDQQKIDRLISQTTFLSLITSSFHILWIPKQHDIAKHHELLASRNAGPLREKGIKYTNRLSEYLTEIYGDSSAGTNNSDYKAIIVVQLPKGDDDDIVELVSSAFTEFKKIVLHPKRFIENIAGMNEPELFDHEYQSYLIKEKQIFDRLSRKMKIRRAPSSMIEWLGKRNFWWGICDPVLRSTDEVDWSPKKSKGIRGGLSTLVYDPRQVLTLAEGEIDASHPRRLTITQMHEGEDTSIHHAYLTLSDLPDTLDMPGSEWLYSASVLPFPVQMSIKVEVLEARDALKKLNRKKMDIDSQVKNVQEAGAAIPFELQEKQERALYLEDEYKKRKNPTFITHVTFGLCHHDINILKGNVKIIQDHYRDFGNIHLELPSGDQWLLFNDFIPGSPRYVSDYIQRIPPETLAAGMVGATQELGDGKGNYIGVTGPLQRPVYVDLRHASQISKSPSFSLTGTLGGGKSMLLNLLGYQNAISGGKTLIFDPKGERSHWPDELPELSGQIQVATLAASAEDQGKLDPFVMLENIEDAKEAAMDILSYLASVKTDSINYSYISQAVNQVASQANPCLIKCIQILYKIGETRPPASVTAEVLDSFKDLSFAKLLFGNGEQKTINMDYAMNILQVQNLKMPALEKSPQDYSLVEKMSIATMYSIGRFMDKFVYFDRGIFTLAEMDEAWAILKTQIGKDMADRVIRTGRSLNGGLAVATQNATDLSGDLAGNIGMKFAFRDSDTKKIKDTLSYFGLEHTTENMDIIKHLDNGQCLMQDIYGRVGVLTVDVVFQHMFDCFDTRPPEQSEHAYDDEDELAELERLQAFYEAAVGEGEPWDDDPDDEKIS